MLGYIQNLSIKFKFKKKNCFPIIQQMSIPEKRSGNKKTGKKVQLKEVQWNKYPRVPNCF